MPTYEYRCDECGASYEVIQKMSDDPLDTCERCGGALRRVMHPVAVHFKGSGFYTTDYGKGSRRPAAAGSDGSTDGGDADAGIAAKADDKPGDAGKSEPSGDGDKPREKQKTT